ncbi:MAG: methyltransferase domain-containing protein [Candidatus Pacebacteria bacterium]|nr:methyltransferase domain-containing protein [Candidatus Paceibacterota bacterium]MCF7856948.1 methyltransferase domain-containing protein [Candidatus Paceibacterota bacterium]
MLKNKEDRAVCRISGEPLIELFTLGELHISDFIDPDIEPRLEPVELKMMLAPKSGLVQLAHTADFDAMYREYWYRSGTNATMRQELKEIAESATKMIHPTSDDVWLDIGCNDGTLLANVDPSIKRVGFDPALNTFLEEESKKHADEVIVDYFTADKYKETGLQKAKIITSIAMFYDLEEPHAFVSDIYDSLDDEGLWIIQMSYLPLMLKQLAFDNICHEHLEYYSLESLIYLLDQHDLRVVDCQLNDINGGSFRIYIRKKDATASLFATAPYRDVAQMRIDGILALEEKMNLKDPRTYTDFFSQIQELKKQTMDFIEQAKLDGKKIMGYGASTKGNTLLQWYGLNDNHIDGIAERSSIKYGKKTAGSNIPIFSEEEARNKKPDYMLVLPWHFINEFTTREKEYLEKGGAFIVPCPKFEIITFQK